MKTKTFTVNIDQKLDEVLNYLKSALGKTSRAETFRLSIALLKIAVEGRDKGYRLVMADENNNIAQEIVLPL